MGVGLEARRLEVERVGESLGERCLKVKGWEGSSECDASRSGWWDWASGHGSLRLMG